MDNVQRGTYCGGKHEIAVVPRSVPHPAITMSAARAAAWAQEAADEDFYQYLQKLAEIYSKRHYTPHNKIDDTKLFVDYKKWKDDGYGGKMSTSSPKKG